MKLSNQQQAETMLNILLNSGRETQYEDRFALPHDDVMMLLELIRECLIADSALA
ncbi:hypothetical protein [Glaciecola petra]|uniref:Uncharacterized protein n=1 Tax=Glaciecola petra TaxID=3075602 RepID=A0ABU2ZXF6_9ALTE|nr:hypothetical protein [Aestuariibacter sp. P117]MDT0596107.1 hypothetical protein [Aestuariibacter sp. P117]